MNQVVATTSVLLKAGWVRALIGGFVGTVVFTLMGKFLAPQIIGQPMDVAALLAPIFSGSHTAGGIAHFVNGSVVFPIAYLILGLRYLPGPAWLRGASFLILLYLVAMVVIMPILGHGFFFGSLPKAMVALMAHIAFGLCMGTIIGRPAEPDK